MSSGTGRATSQNSGIDWKDNLERIRHPANCLPELSGRSWYLPEAATPMARPKTKVPRVARDDNSLVGSLLGRLDAEIFHHHLQILPRLALLSRIAQQERGMISDGQTRSWPRSVAARRLEVVPAATEFRHRRADGQQIFCGRRAQSNHRLRPDRGNMPHEKRRASFALVALGLAVARRTAFHDVRDINIFAPQAHGFDHVVEQLAGAADERLSLGVSIRARALANEHQLGARIAHAKHDLLPALVKFAASAIAEVFTNQFQRSCGIG